MSWYLQAIKNYCNFLCSWLSPEQSVQTDTAMIRKIHTSDNQ